VITGTVPGHQESGGPALVQRAEQGKHRYVQDPGHYAGREAVACHGRGLHQRPGGIRQLYEPVSRRLRHPSRHRHRPAAPLLGEHAGQLAHQERIAPRFGVHLIGLVCRRRQPGRGQHIPDRARGQATEVHPFSVGIRRQTQQQPGARVTRGRRLPVGRQHQDERPSQLAHDICQQDRRRLVRPLQIIEHQQQPARPGRLRQPPANLREHREPLGAAGIGAIGQRRSFGVTKDTRPQARTKRVITGGPDDGLIQHQLPQAVRWQAVPVGRPGPHHRHAPRGGQRGGLLRQPGLPDPRLTRAQHQAAATRQDIIQQQHDPSQLAVTAHHRPRGPAPHTSHQATIKLEAIGVLVVNGIAGGPHDHRQARQW